MVSSPTRSGSAMILSVFTVNSSVAGSLTAPRLESRRGARGEAKAGAVCHQARRASSSVSRISKTLVKRVSSRTSCTALFKPNRTSRFLVFRASLSTSTSEAMPELSTYRTSRRFTTSRGVFFKDSSRVLRKPGEVPISMSPVTSTMVVPVCSRVAVFIEAFLTRASFAVRLCFAAGEVLLEAQPVPLGKSFVANFIHDLPDEVGAAPAQSGPIQGLRAKPGGVRSLATIDEGELQAIRLRLAVQFDLLVTPILVSMPDNVAQRFVDGE